MLDLCIGKGTALYTENSFNFFQSTTLPLGCKNQVINTLVALDGTLKNILVYVSIVCNFIFTNGFYLVCGFRM